MIAIAVSALFAIATFIALSVTTSSLHRAWCAYGELRQALALCETRQDVIVKMKAVERPARQPRLRPAPSVRRVSRPAQQSARSAAA